MKPARTYVFEPDPVALFTMTLLALLQKRRNVRILEAGGGSISVMPIDRIDLQSIDAIDVSADQLARNDYATNKMLMDLHQYDPGETRYDCATCYNVIEHLNDVRTVIGSLAKSVDSRGLLVIGAPLPNSFAGFVTRVTPHWFHVFVYRRLLKSPHAGEPGHAPFKTVYHELVSPSRLIPHLQTLGFECVYYAEYDSGRLAAIRNKNPIIGSLIYFAVNLLDIITLRQLRILRGDYHLIAEKIAHVAPSPPERIEASNVHEQNSERKPAGEELVVDFKKA